MALKTAKLKMVIKIPAYLMLEKCNSYAKFSFNSSMG
jgi:hypothetical protein